MQAGVHMPSGPSAHARAQCQHWECASRCAHAHVPRANTVNVQAGVHMPMCPVHMPRAQCQHCECASRCAHAHVPRAQCTCQGQMSPVYTTQCTLVCTCKGQMCPVHMPGPSADTAQQAGSTRRVAAQQ